jgi:hypothetical protein
MKMGCWFPSLPRLEHPRSSLAAEKVLESLSD